MKNIIILLFLFSIISFENTMNAQGYVSPFKYENGNVIMKSRNEIRSEEYNREMSNKKKAYEYDNKNVKKKTEKTVEKIYYEKIDYKKIQEEKRIKDSIKRIEVYKNAWKSSGYTLSNRYKLKEIIEDMMNDMEYEKVDSITFLYNYQLDDEKYKSSDWDHYRSRLGNRMIVQIFLNQLDSAWKTILRIEESDKEALNRRFYTYKNDDIDLMKAYLLYYTSSYPEALSICNQFIEMAKEPMSPRHAYMYCIKSLCLNAMGNTIEAKKNLDNYMANPKNNSSLVMNYNNYPKPFICETYGILFENMKKIDSAIIYYEHAAKTYTELTGLKGVARKFNVPYFSTVYTVFIPPVTIGFYKHAILKGYDINDENNEGKICLHIASRMGIIEAEYILANKIQWTAPKIIKGEKSNKPIKK